jgi:hypothetical protein
MAIVQGDLPQVPALLEASLVPVEKVGGGVRSFAVGEVWYQLACLCGLAGCPGA